MARNECIRTWKQAGFTLHLYDTYSYDRLGKSILAYEFYDHEEGDEPLFTGADFHCSPLHAIDSDETLAALLGFLSLHPFAPCSDLLFAQGLGVPLAVALGKDLDRVAGGLMPAVKSIDESPRY